VKMWKGRLEKSTLVTVSEKILVPNRRLCARKRSQISPPCLVFWRVGASSLCHCCRQCCKVNGDSSHAQSRHKACSAAEGAVQR